MSLLGATTRSEFGRSCSLPSFSANRSQAAYHGRAMPVLNRMIEGQATYSSDYDVEIVLSIRFLADRALTRATRWGSDSG